MRHEHIIAFRLAQVWALAKLAVAYVIALFYRRKRIWLVAERGIDARDNGYWFFRYMKEYQPDVEVYYIISKDSIDRKRLADYESSLIDYCSMAHYILLWRASVLISAHVQGYFPFTGLGLWLKKICPAYRAKCHVNLQHGITKDKLPFMYYSNTRLDLLIAGVAPEYEYAISAHGYPREAVQLTGFCRFDGLINSANGKQILLMPTWREWLYKEEDFVGSEYAQKYSRLLCNKQLYALLEQYDMRLVFYPHHEVQKHIAWFMQFGNDRIVIANQKEYDVQQLLRQSDVLITDYSSVYFDFAYMRKPIIYYLFDYERYRSEHYAAGWYDYFNGLGSVAATEAECVDLISAILKEHCQMPEIYRKRAEQMFQYADSNNCKRVYEAICEVEKRKIQY